MVRSQLNSYSGSDPIWGFVALIGAERFTGEAAVGLDPRVRLFAVDGRVYFAEREGDAPIGSRLVSCGAVTATQLEHGSVRIGDAISIARLFQREPGVDRDAVELTIESSTEALLESIANKPVAMPEVFPLRHHSSGIHHWLRSVTAPATALHAATVDTPDGPLDEAPVDASFTLEPVGVLPAAEEPSPVEHAVEEPVAVEEPAIQVPVVEAPLWQPSWQPTVPVLTTLEPVIDPEPVPLVPFDPFKTAADEPANHRPAPTLHAWPLTDAAPADTATIELPVVDEPALDEPSIEADTAEETERPALPELVPMSWSQPHSAEPEPEPEAVTAEAAAEPVVEAPPALLPSLSSLPTLGSMTAAVATSPDTGDEPATQSEPASEPTLSAMPTLGSLTSFSALSSPPVNGTEPAEPVSSADFFDSLESHPLTASPANPYEPGPTPTGLPKLASAPISMDELAARADAVAAAAPHWSGPGNTLAAVDIWEMVDDLLVEPDSGDQDLVASGGEKRGRGWLRGRKG